MTPARIDLHQHFFPAGFVADGLRRFADDTGWRFPPENFPWSPEKNLQFMDRLGIETAILSSTGSPGGDGVGPANRAAARFLNVTAHQAVIDHPEPDRILYGSDFPAIDLATAAWYTHNVDAYFAECTQQSEDVMRNNALALFPELGAKSRVKPRR